MTMAPIRYWGDVSYEHRVENYDQGEDQVRKLATVNLKGNSFLWQPWFARVNAGLGLTYNRLDRDSSGTSSGEIVTGNARLLMLPQSRFPLELHFENQDSRVTGEALGSKPYSNTRYGLSQKYRSRDGSLNAQATYDNNLQKTEGQANDTSDLYTLSLGKLIKRNQFNLDASREKAQRRSTNINYLRNNAIARHSYRPDSSFSIENMASVVETTDETTSFTNNNRQLQITADSKTLNAYGGINYDITRAFRVTGNLTANDTENNNTSTFTSTQSLGTRYNPELIGEFSGQHLTGQLGHNMLRRYSTRPGLEYSTNFSQSFVTEYDTVADNINRVNNSLSFTWRQGEGAGNVYLRLMGSDSRTVASPRDEVYQLINLQLTSNQSLTHKSAWTGNITIHATKNELPNVVSGGFATTSSANILYRHVMVFSVPRLHFISDLKFDTELSRPVEINREKQERRIWENRLDYSVGRLQMRLSLRVSKINNISYNILMFRIKRLFGN